MIKLQDFAKEQGVTDRAIQKHVKKYEKELEGLYERKGPNGTWLSDEACAILRSKMKVNVMVLEKSQDEIEVLKEKISELENRIERKDVIIEKLQDRADKKEELIESMKKDRLLIEEKTAEQIKAAEDKLKLELEQKHQESERKLQQHYTEEVKELQKELGTFKKSIFGFYRKTSK